MSPFRLGRERIDQARDAWRVPAQPARLSWWRRLLRRKPEPTTYQKFLAVHMAGARPRGGLS